ncbi:group II intron reverse transcriptase/maturase [Thermobifida halotolerans]|uniref:Group II intron reverse transcriptase/maturase n=1 Tax=Thermobifida halotolerans TaxID=483545 RepID=A0AA97M6C2_9ACTN|nr:group II intron reverse transcriptase/maturase [Thermobifida halotolerans]UOE21970.1 group II intron reverse transcriptase/maturase [Thermobifida halotolerans]
MGKLDTREVNGPEGSLEWGALDWRFHEKEVRRLRQRIFKATREQNWPQVRNLQKLMLRSRSNTLVSVRRVTQHNAGRMTAGIDGQVALSGEDRIRVADQVDDSRRTWRPRPVRRVHIPKSGRKTRMRPLGIPVIMDRCHQARVRNALEPEWEAQFEARSYGFRPGRGCHDAIAYLFSVLGRRDAKRLWILDADLSAAFDRIDHGHLLSRIRAFPARDMIRRWLKAGVMERRKGFTPTEEGSPQGGVISPLLLNVALHGLEEAAGTRLYTSASRYGVMKPGSPAVVRYADDFAVCCFSQEQAEQIQRRLAEWLKPRGLSLNEEKTHVVHVSQGFDFLGFTIRRYHGKLLITPSKKAVSRLRERLKAEMHRLRGSNAGAVVLALTPVIRGWSAYYRGVVSSRVFKKLDEYVWWLTWRWAKRTHPGKSRYWVKQRYFGRFNKVRNDNWVFGDRDSGAYLVKFSWTPIVRHVMVKAGSSIDDPDLASYWTHRRSKVKPPLDEYTLSLLSRQGGVCSLCGEVLLSADQPPQSPREWERWWLVISRKAISAGYLAYYEGPGPAGGKFTSLVHDSCRRGLAAQMRRDTAGRFRKSTRSA